MNVQIGSTVEFFHAGVNWRGRVFNILDKKLQVVVDGYEGIFFIPPDFSPLRVISQ